MATCSKRTESLESNENDDTLPPTLESSAKKPLTQEQLDRIETNRKRALELRKSKQNQENPAKMFEIFLKTFFKPPFLK